MEEETRTASRVRLGIDRAAAHCATATELHDGATLVEVLVTVRHIARRLAARPFTHRRAADRLACDRYPAT